MHWIILVVAALCFAGNATAQAVSTTFSSRVICRWDAESATAPCDGGLAISGERSSSISIVNIPQSLVDVTIETGEQEPYTYEDVPSETGEIQVVVHKSRRFGPTYSDKKIRNRVDAGSSRPDLRVVLNGTHPVLMLRVSTARGGRSFEIPVRFQVWWLTTGGFYAFAFAADDEIRLVPTAAGRARVTIEDGNSFDPVTGVAFNLHPTNYPNLHFEFGTATGGNRPTSYFLGAGLRLLEYDDRAVLTLAGGAARVGQRRFPDVDTALEYDAADPLLTGRIETDWVPYLSIGLGLNLGGTTGLLSGK